MLNFFKSLFGSRKPPENPKSIFIGLIGGVGDLVCAAPSVTALKKKFPDATIRFGVGNSFFKDVILGHPGIDSYESPFFYNVWKSRERRNMEREQYEKHDWVLLLDNASREWWKEGKHLVDIYQEKCGVQLERRQPEMYLNRRDEERAREFLQSKGIEDDDYLIVLSPETRSKKEMKEWPPERFDQLIEKIHAHKKVKFLNFVSEENPHPFNGTISAKGFPLRPSAAIIRRSSLFIGLDNGLTHIASCFDIKMLSIHIGFPVECSGPLSPRAVVVAHEPFSPPESITVEEVFNKVQQLIDS
ncbi:MAG: glycosyltransferase family 9 protein [Candidatus Nitrohelix vancouverensis]|uniref:Glycosyltransferase family 9 protein n=1 Tax=Candidatus Nitrohelix vancouverensis TaxID=2705534 RepID=A0A7T0C289_9BACT|nr:MAG: glycosyltransferase family 9 protein [Candidatus Nitrohelix vancouverensis]